ncbi:MAG: UvrD-helicase domain-containing protein, partial [Odoribacter sp.]|nr:UvrD-helicase domain-containing protein [Odoribacter sp.]
MLDIYKASAGSGKTFALTLSYFKIIFAVPVEYKNILAVTFTNKATEEMKSRIINELHCLAEGKASEYGKILKQELQLSDEQLKNKASLLRTILLHDYGRLAVTTIDRFFQRILKAFTRELGIFPGYNVELDSDYVLQKAVDKVMQQVKDNPGLSDWISELMNSNVEDGKSWNIKSKIATLGEELFKENYMLLDKRIIEKFKDKSFLRTYRDFLNTIVKEYEGQLADIAGQALQVIRTAGLVQNDFKSGKSGCASWFYKLEAGNFDAPSSTVRKGGNDPDIWIAKTSPKKNEIENIRGELMCYLQQALDIFDRKYAKYLSAR